MNSNHIREVVSGLLIGVLIIRMFHLTFAPMSYQMFSLFLAYTACVYFGAALSDDRYQVISIELAMSFVFFTCACLGLLYSGIWLVVGYAMHGIWDMLHHSHMVKTKVTAWFPPLCAAVDFVIAVFVFIYY